ncbi:hypothetical protein [Burkholderia cenocepacia]|uniref:hypothetical protein n=1 Tax=Burkholderia cenocepacia TaxID=95486 RepID=UPI000761D5C6|nr:hypothetical protein [Burkholderia cenocepacia]
MNKALRIFVIACALAAIGSLLSLGCSVLTSGSVGLPQANDANFTNGLGLLACAGLLAVAAFNKFLRSN